MRTRLATITLCSAAWLTGCSLTSNFSDFRFGSAGSNAADGGMVDSGTIGNPNAGTNATAGTNAPNAGAGGGGGGTSGNTAAGTGGTGGAGGQPGDTPCTNDSDCGDTNTYHCVLKHCLVRRVPSGIWLSGGGGITRSSQYVMHISVGAPAPMGVTSSKSFSITVGAGAGRP